MDDRARETIIQELESGSSVSVACGLAGVHPGTYAEWIRKGRMDTALSTPQGQFYLDIMRAKATHEKQLIGEVRGNAAWQAKKFLLENMYPETWSPKQRVELTGANGGPITTRDLDGLSDEQLWRMVNGESLEEVLNDGSSEQ